MSRHRADAPTHPETTWATDVETERRRAHDLHGGHSMESTPWTDPQGRRLRVLVEEVGEVAKALNDHELRDAVGIDLRAALDVELLQVATMAIAWREALHGRPLPAPPRDVQVAVKVAYGNSVGSIRRFTIYRPNHDTEWVEVLHDVLSDFYRVALTPNDVRTILRAWRPELTDHDRVGGMTISPAGAYAAAVTVTINDPEA